jgi:hypothetical protein
MVVVEISKNVFLLIFQKHIITIVLMYHQMKNYIGTVNISVSCCDKYTYANITLSFFLADKDDNYSGIFCNNLIGPIL